MASNTAETFWAKVDKKGPIPSFRPELGPCWIFKGQHDKSGYGRLSWNNRKQFAHRIAYELLNGPIPEGKQLDHLCRVHDCVRHTEPVTNYENMMRGNCPTSLNAKKTHCIRGHKMEGDNVRVYHFRNGTQRTCMPCRRMTANRAHARRAILKRMANAAPAPSQTP